MDYVTGILNNEITTLAEMYESIGSVVRFKGTVHKIREMSGFAFVIIRTGRDLIQCVYSKEFSEFELGDIAEGYSVSVTGKIVSDDRAASGLEILMQHAAVLSKPAEELPVVINKRKLDITLDTTLTFRPIALRNPAERAIFKIQEGIVRGFREFLLKRKFTEIRTPKIVFAGAEGGANIFRLDYFGKQVFLAQSPQFYKQAMVGVFDRVFEVAPVYRAEKHNTSRHLNEYISMDFEMGFIESYTDIMNIETGMLKYMLQLLKEEYAKELELLKVSIPQIEPIPAIKFTEAKDIISRVYKKKITDHFDFEPEEEQLICDYVQKNYNSEFVFITHYPSSKRPFYAMDDESNPSYTLSFDLLFRGVEITTGGQRIHNYDKQIEKMLNRGMNPEEFESYLMIHKYGIPPHGGLGAGLERLTMKLLALRNVRNASLFPRDMNRVIP